MLLLYGYRHYTVAIFTLNRIIKERYKVDREFVITSNNAASGPFVLKVLPTEAMDSIHTWKDEQDSFCNRCGREEDR